MLIVFLDRSLSWFRGNLLDCEHFDVVSGSIEIVNRFSAKKSTWQVIGRIKNSWGRILNMQTISE